MLLAAMGQLLNYREGHGDQEYSDARSGEHASDHSEAHNVPRQGASTRRRGERYASQNEREGGHQDRSQPEFGAFQGRVLGALTLVVLDLRELDDQNGVLGGQADQHDEPDLRVDV